MLCYFRARALRESHDHRLLRACQIFPRCSWISPPDKRIWTPFCILWEWGAWGHLLYMSFSGLVALSYLRRSYSVLSCFFQVSNVFQMLLQKFLRRNRQRYKWENQWHTVKVYQVWNTTLFVHGGFDEKCSNSYWNHWFQILVLDSHID